MWVADALWPADHCWVTCCITGCAPLMILSGKIAIDTQWTSLVLQQMQGLIVSVVLAILHPLWRRPLTSAPEFSIFTFSHQSASLHSRDHEGKILTHTTWLFCNYLHHEVMFSPVSACWFVGLSAGQKLPNRFPPNLYGGRFTAQNGPH